MKMSALDWTVWTLVIVGGINWGLVGFFKYDLVAAIFGGSTVIVARIIYVLIGLSAIYLLVTVDKMLAKK